MMYDVKNEVIVTYLFITFLSKATLPFFPDSSTLNESCLYKENMWEMIVNQSISTSFSVFYK
jgi:hypothetical protein